jgi:hypothetical protein
MSRALSVYHGHFGRATLYELNRPMTTHAHREGHLTFYRRRRRSCVSCRQAARADRRCGVAVNPWEPHASSRATYSGGVYLVLYIDQTGSAHGPGGHARCASAARDRGHAAHHARS